MTKCREISPPKWLTQPGQNHYRQLVKELTDNGIYNPLEKGLIEMMAQLYADARDPELPKKEQRESIKLYARLIKIVGSRGHYLLCHDLLSYDLEQFIGSDI